MSAPSLLQSKNKEEVMPVQCMKQVISAKYLPNIPDAEAFRKIGFFLGFFNFSYRNFFHSKILLINELDGMLPMKTNRCELTRCISLIFNVIYFSTKVVWPATGKIGQMRS
ncbi:MAG: hypothetical protein EPGJADBJ_00101 [Saprospiraceae bacterium]|nr:hypothetical protein [Saprospiraceae bacterium]